MRLLGCCVPEQRWSEHAEEAPTNYFHRLNRSVFMHWIRWMHSIAIARSAPTEQDSGQPDLFLRCSQHIKTLQNTENLPKIRRCPCHVSACARVSTKEALISTLISRFGSVFRAWREAQKSWSARHALTGFDGRVLDPLGRGRLSWGWVHVRFSLVFVPVDHAKPGVHQKVRHLQESIYTQFWLNLAFPSFSCAEGWGCMATCRLLHLLSAFVWSYCYPRRTGLVERAWCGTAGHSQIVWSRRGHVKDKSQMSQLSLKETSNLIVGCVSHAAIQSCA